MPARPKISYFLYHSKRPVSHKSNIWKLPLPLHRNCSDFKCGANGGMSTSYGEYFRAVRKFLEKDQFELIFTAVSKQIRRKISPEKITEICVCLEKHGAFYHPARIGVGGDDFCTAFVLNVALSQAGRDCIEKEYHFLKKLNYVLKESFFPKVYGRAEMRLKDDQKIGMFLGEWFDGYHEFHISRDPADNTKKIKVWNPERRGFYLSSRQSLELYRQASRILTCCYNVETTEQIFSWHHASGDFIIKLENETIDLKLVAVRHYDSVIKDMDTNIEVILNALLVFFLSLTIRMRLDRMNGVGKIVWSDDLTVPGTIRGFFEGLAQKPPVELLPGPIEACFSYYILSCTYTDLMKISHAILDSYPKQAPEFPVIKKHLPDHMVVLWRTIHELNDLNKA